VKNSVILLYQCDWLLLQLL